MTDLAALRAIEYARELHSRSVGEPFLPDGWRELVRYIGPLLDIAEVAHELVGSTTHVNVSGPEYAERKLMYDKVRTYLGRLV